MRGMVSVDVKSLVWGEVARKMEVTTVKLRSDFLKLEFFHCDSRRSLLHT